MIGTHFNLNNEANEPTQPHELTQIHYRQHWTPSHEWKITDHSLNFQHVRQLTGFSLYFKHF